MSKYTDLDFNFFRHPSSGDIILKHNEEAIRNSLRNLIMTSKYERPFRDNLYCNIRRCLFEPITPMTAYIIRQEIIDIVKQYEPRILLQKVAVVSDSDRNFYSVSIYYRAINQPDIQRVSLQLERLR